MNHNHNIKSALKWHFLSLWIGLAIKKSPHLRRTIQLFDNYFFPLFIKFSAAMSCWLLGYLLAHLSRSSEIVLRDKIDNTPVIVLMANPI